MTCTILHWLLGKQGDAPDKKPPRRHTNAMCVAQKRQLPTSANTNCTTGAKTKPVRASSAKTARQRRHINAVCVAKKRQVLTSATTKCKTERRMNPVGLSGAKTARQMNSVEKIYMQCVWHRKNRYRLQQTPNGQQNPERIPWEFQVQELRGK